MLPPTELLLLLKLEPFYGRFVARFPDDGDRMSLWHTAIGFVSDLTLPEIRKWWRLITTRVGKLWIMNQIQQIIPQLLTSASQSTGGNFSVPKFFRFKNIVLLQKYSAVLQNWADWPGQAGTNKWAEWNEICRFKKIMSLPKYSAA